MVESSPSMSEQLRDLRRERHAQWKKKGEKEKEKEEEKEKEKEEDHQGGSRIERNEEKGGDVPARSRSYPASDSDQGNPEPKPRDAQHPPTPQDIEDMEDIFDCELRDPSGMRVIGSVRLRVGLDGATIENQNGILGKYAFTRILSWFKTGDKCFTFTVRTEREAKQDIAVWGPPQLIRAISNSVDSKVARLMVLKKEGYDINQLKSPSNSPAAGASMKPLAMADTTARASTSACNPAGMPSTSSLSSGGQKGGVALSPLPVPQIFHAPRPTPATAPPLISAPDTSGDAELARRLQQQEEEEAHVIAVERARRSEAERQRGDRVVEREGRGSHHSGPSGSNPDTRETWKLLSRLSYNFAFTLVTAPWYAAYVAGSWALAAYRSRREAGTYNFIAAEAARNSGSNPQHTRERREGRDRGRPSASSSTSSSSSSSRTIHVRARNHHSVTSHGGARALLSLMREVLLEGQMNNNNNNGRVRYAPRVARLVASGLGPGGADQMSYEQLLSLQEQIGFEDRGATEEQIRELPTRTFREGETSNRESSSSDKNECSICLDQYKQGQEIRTLPCLHSFHVECVDKWLKHNKSCPLCKHDVC